MIIIGKPYVSNFLIRTIKENNFQVISTPESRNMISDESINWITEKEARSIFKKNPNHPIYTNSENTINWIENNLNSSKLPDQIQVFKNKIKFRKLLKDAFPKQFFEGVKYDGLRNVNIEKIKFPIVIKPAVGFFSIAVHKIDKPSEWNTVLDKIENEIDKLNGLYPKEVLDTTDFIIEGNMEGEEYAVDCYFNNKGEPVILNIFHHIFSSEKDVSDRIYSSSKKIIEKNHNGIQNFLIAIGTKTNLKNFPLHVEVKIDESGKINPIEINPLRFGGWCTTGDFSWYAYGFNSYEYFLNNKKPDWEKIFKNKKEKKYSIIVLNNNSGINEKEIEQFYYEQLLNDFERPLDLRKVDFNKYSVFGFLFTETTYGNEIELNQILNSNLKKYIKIKSSFIS